MHIKEGISTDTLASLRLAGDISEESLRKNIARFNKKVKDFKNQHRISYSGFEIEGQVATAYLTRDGIDHSVGGVSGPQKAAAFDLLFSLIKTAEYTYSTKMNRTVMKTKESAEELSGIVLFQ